MKRLLAASVGMVLSVVVGQAWAGPPQDAGPARTVEVRRQDDIAPLSSPGVRRGASAAPTPTTTRILPAAYPAQTLPEVLPLGETSLTVPAVRAPAVTPAEYVSA